MMNTEDGYKGPTLDGVVENRKDQCGWVRILKE